MAAPVPPFVPPPARSAGNARPPAFGLVLGVAVGGGVSLVLNFVFAYWFGGVAGLQREYRLPVSSGVAALGAFPCLIVGGVVGVVFLAARVRGAAAPVLAAVSALAASMGGRLVALALMFSPGHVLREFFAINVWSLVSLVLTPAVAAGFALLGAKGQPVPPAPWVAPQPLGNDYRGHGYTPHSGGPPQV